MKSVTNQRFSKLLPESDTKQTALDQIRRFIEEFHPSDSLPTWVYRDNADFGAVNGANGKRQILLPEEARAIRGKQRRYRQPRLPKIQGLLKLAYELKNRLDKTPGLTRDTLARKQGFSPSYLTRVLSLLNLAPAIQKHILALLPSVRMGPLTERSLRPLTKIQDQDFQVKKFERLLSLNRKTQPAVFA